MVCLSTAYLPPISYVALLVQKRKAEIEYCEHFVKQSYRNRCRILGPNGVQALTVPVDRSAWRKPIKDLEISYAENWPEKHWRALETAYNNSPFFAVLGDDIKYVYDSKPRFLVELNKSLLALIFDWLQEFEVDYYDTATYVKEPETDLRNAFSPKQKSPLINPEPYFQRFNTKYGFQSDLSVIDLIFHEGRAAWDYLNDAKLEIEKGRS